MNELPEGEDRARLNFFREPRQLVEDRINEAITENLPIYDESLYVGATDFNSLVDGIKDRFGFIAAR